MADEQTPQSDLIDDAIRQAERQLEEKLEALRMSALGEPSAPHTEPSEDIAVLRPTSGSRTDSPTDTQSQPSTEWHETESDDLTFAPVGGTPLTGATELYVPEPLGDVELPYTPDSETQGGVSGLVASWDDEDGEDEPSFDLPPEPRTSGSSASTPASSREPETFAEALAQAPIEEHSDEDADEDWDHPEPVHASWSDRGGMTSPARSVSEPVVATPSEAEMEFWAHTRTALRNIQEATTALPTQLTEDVASEVERIVRAESADPAAALRAIQQQLQNLPKQTERVESAIEQAMTAPNAGIRQLRDELPTQLDRTVRETRQGIREELDRSAGTIHNAVQQDVAQLEQSIATNVTRMAHSNAEGTARLERDLDDLGETIVRFERGVHGEFDRVEAQLRATITQVEQSLREELVQPAETVRKLDEELPARFGRVERTLLEQVQTTQRELAHVLSNLVDANRASLDRLASITSTLDEDRARRGEDVDVIVDTVTTGWEGIAGAIKALYEQGEANSRRIAEVEARVARIHDLEGAVEATMAELRGHVRDLQPAPVVVTVAHPEAEVRNSARGGWLPESSN